MMLPQKEKLDQTRSEASQLKKSEGGKTSLQMQI
jgi:hypothetical protein